MKSILIALAALCVSAPVFAGKVVRDASGAWTCQRTGSDTIVYWPAGRVPNNDEQLECAQSGGKIQEPKGPTRAPTAPEERN